MYRGYLGVSAVALAGLMALAATAQEKKEGSSEKKEGSSSGQQRAAPQREGASAAPQREGSSATQQHQGATTERREGEIRSGNEIRRDGEIRSGAEIRRDGEIRGGYYSGQYYDGGRWYGRGYNYGPGYSSFGWRPRYGYGYGFYDGGYAFDNSYYDEGWNTFRPRRLIRGGPGYLYGSYDTPYASSSSADCNTHSGSARNGYAYGAMDPNAALIDVKLGAANAQLFFDDAQTQQTGTMRQFVTPALEPKKDFSYMIHAKWKEGDRDMDDTRTVKVHAGDRLTVDFTTKQEPAQTNGAKPEAAPRPGLGDNGAAPPPPEAAQQFQGADQGNLEVHEGQFLSFKEGTLEMTDTQGKKHSHHLAPGAQIMINGQPAKPEDLKADMKLKVSTKKGDPQTATKIEVKSQGKQNGEKRAPDLGAPPAPKQPNQGAAPAPKQPGEKPAPDKGAPPPPEQPKQ